MKMHTVAQTRAFERQAADAGMTAEEIEALILFLAADPLAGDEIVGTGGCRKVRWARTGRGKSGGYRIITFYSGESMPVYMIAAFAKGMKADLSHNERNGLRRLTKLLIEAYKSRQGET